MSRENDIFGIVGAFNDDQEKPRYLTSFEVLRVEEEVRTIDDIRDGKVVRIDLPFCDHSFSSADVASQAASESRVDFFASRWASPGYCFGDIFPIPGSEYYGFQDDEAGKPGWRPQLDGTLYATLAAARAACGKGYRGIAIAELWPIVLSSDEED
jgi:hypothetical protein